MSNIRPAVVKQINVAAQKSGAKRGTGRQGSPVALSARLGTAAAVVDASAKSNRGSAATRSIGSCTNPGIGGGAVPRGDCEALVGICANERADSGTHGEST